MSFFFQFISWSYLYTCLWIWICLRQLLLFFPSLTYCCENVPWEAVSVGMAQRIMGQLYHLETIMRPYLCLKLHLHAKSVHDCSSHTISVIHSLASLILGRALQKTTSALSTSSKKIKLLLLLNCNCRCYYHNCMHSKYDHIASLFP